MSKDRLGQEERDEPEYPRPRMSSQVISFLGRPLWIEWGYCPLNDSPLTMVDLATRSDCQQGVVMRVVFLLQMDLDQPQWRAQDKDTEGPSKDWHQGQTWWNQRDQTRHVCSTWWCLSHGLSSGGSGEFKPWWFYLARNWVDQLNFIIPFWEIWFDLILVTLLSC